VSESIRHNGKVVAQAAQKALRYRSAIEYKPPPDSSARSHSDGKFPSVLLRYANYVDEVGTRRSVEQKAGFPVLHQTGSVK